MFSSPARSAIVLATLSILVYALAERFNFENASFNEGTTSSEESLSLDNKNSDVEKIAPKMIVKLIREGIEVDLLAVTDNSGQNTDNVIVGNSVFLIYAVITADNVVLLSDLEYSVKNVHSVSSDIKRTIVLF
jgi:hypothetical protein